MSFNKKRWLILIAALVLFVITACSGDKQNNTNTKEKTISQENKKEQQDVQKQDDSQEVDTTQKQNDTNNDPNESRIQFDTLEERLALDLSKAAYNGDDYDESEVLAILEKLPDNQSAETFYEELLMLLGEDYREYHQFFNEFDTSILESTATPEEKQQKEKQSKATKQLNVSILIDASGSMNAVIDGKTKMALAKEAVQTFASELPEEANVSLIVYGHKGSSAKSDKKQSCATIDEVYPLGEYDNEAFQKALNAFEPAGWTPLGGALAKAQSQIETQTSDGDQNIIYVVSDGVETCDTDPIKAAKSLTNANTQTIVNIIGFDVEDEGQKQLKNVAEAGNGDYSTVRTKQELESFFEDHSTELLNDWYDWESSNLNVHYSSESERLNHLYQMENDMVNLSYTEENRISTLTYTLEQTKDFDAKKVRAISGDTAKEIRSYARVEGKKLREEIRDGSKNARDEIRDKSKTEREKIRNQSN